MQVPVTELSRRRAARDELAALLDSCRSELAVVRADIAWSGGADRAAEDLQRRLSRTLECLESAVVTIVHIDRLASSPSTNGAETPILFREADHRMKNGLTTVVSLLQRQAATSGDVAVSEALRVASARVAVVTQLHALLGNVTLVAGDDRAVSLDAYLASVGKAVAQAMHAEEEGGAIEVTAAPAPATPNTAQSLGLVVTELAIHGLRHACRPGRAGRVRVLGERRTGVYRLTVAHDGDQVREAVCARQSAGPDMRLVQTLANQLGARLTSSRPEGTRVTLEIDEPLSA